MKNYCYENCTVLFELDKKRGKQNLLQCSIGLHISLKVYDITSSVHCTDNDLAVVICVCASVCLSVSLLPQNQVPTSFLRRKQILYGVSNVFTVWLSLKILLSRVMAPFAGHCCLPRSLANVRRPNETAMASFQLEKYIYIWLVIDPTTRLVHH